MHNFYFIFDSQEDSEVPERVQKQLKDCRKMTAEASGHNLYEVSVALCRKMTAEASGHNLYEVSYTLCR